MSRRVDIKAGEYLFREGDPPTSAYLIESGQVEISTLQKGQPLLLSVLGEGDLLGEMAVIDQSPRTADARARTDAVLIEVDQAQISERIGNADPIVRALLRGQLFRYRNALAQLRSGTSSESVTAFPAGQAHVDADGYDNSAVAKIWLETQLRDALVNGELDVRFQPIFEIAERRIAGYEALVRWTHPTRGAISPMEFIALAEETSLILPVGDYVLDRVAGALARIMQADNASSPFIAVNMSGRQLAEADMLAAINRAADKHGIDRRQIKVEVTESLTLDYERVGELIGRCHAAGIKVALDDFGTGYSNLGHLHKLKFNTVKLDQGFVRQMLDAPRSLAIVKAIIEMVRALEADLVAEGVETEAQLNALGELNCRYAQGYLIGKPQSLDEVMERRRQ